MSSFVKIYFFTLENAKTLVDQMLLVILCIADTMCGVASTMHNAANKMRGEANTMCGAANTMHGAADGMHVR